MNAYSILTNTTCQPQVWLIPVIYRQAHQSGSCSDCNITKNSNARSASALPDDVLPEDLRHHATSTVPPQFGLRVYLRNCLASTIHPMDCTCHESEWLFFDHTFDGGVA